MINPRKCIQYFSEGGGVRELKEDYKEMLTQ